MSKLTTKQQYWTEHLTNAERSDGSLANYARQNNITPQTLYRWRNTLRQRTQTTVSTETLFTQAMVLPEQRRADLTLNVGEVQLSFTQLPDPNWLANFLSLRSAL